MGIFRDMGQEIKKCVENTPYRTAKEITRFVAPIAALASTAGAGGDGYLDNILSVYNAPRQLWEIGEALVRNEGARDFLFERTGDLWNLLGSTVNNFVERPAETAIAAAGVYAGIRLAPMTVRGVSKAVRYFKGRNPEEQ
ncbi:MAG: hypothetical protein ABH849_03810 [Nanoarchaeota archaeon]